MQTVMLAPSPTRKGMIDRVVVIGQQGDAVTVLSVDGLAHDPTIMNRVNPGYLAAVKTWSVIAGLVAIGGIALSFTWAWWAFFPGLVIAYVLRQANRMSVADFGVESIASDPSLVQQMRAKGLVWDAAANTVVPS